MAYFIIIIAFYLSCLCPTVCGMSSFGKEFYVGIPGNLAQNRNNTIQLDFASKIPGEIQMNVPYFGYNETRPINRHLKLLLNSRLEMFSTGQGNRGIYIKSTVHISVYVTSYTEASGDTFLAFPLDSLGTEYDVIAYPSGWQAGYPSEVVFVAPFDGTVVNMTNGQNSTVVHLDRLDVYQMFTTTEGLTNSHVTSNKPITLFTAASCDYIPNTNQRCNMNFAQWLPVDKWGKTAIIPPIAFSRPLGLLIYSLNQSVHHCVQGMRMISSFCVSGSRGEAVYHSYDGSLAISVYADGRFIPVLYKQHETFVTLVPGIEQFATEYYIVFPEVYTNQAHFITITVPKASSSGLLVDGSLLPPNPMSSTDVPPPFDNYTIITYQVFTTGYHTITHRDGNVTFGVLCYGYGNLVNHTVIDDGFAAYGFSAGFHEGPPIPGLTCENGGTVVGNACLCASRFAGEHCQIDADCTFDADTICNWTNSQPGDNFDWVVHHSTTPSDDTGPTNDHTLGTTKGVYVV